MIFAAQFVGRTKTGFVVLRCSELFFKAFRWYGELLHKYYVRNCQLSNLAAVLLKTKKKKTVFSTVFIKAGPMPGDKVICQP